MSSFQFEQIGVIRSPIKTVASPFRASPAPGRSLRRTASDSALQPKLSMPSSRPGSVQPFVGAFSFFIRRWTAAGGQQQFVRLCLGGNARMASFCLRAHVPPQSDCGMSPRCAKRYRVPKRERNSEIRQRLDLVDGMPVVDIKPYLPFEALPDAAAASHMRATGADS